MRRLLSQLLLGAKTSGQPVQMLTSDTEFYSLTRQVCPGTQAEVSERSDVACTWGPLVWSSVRSKHLEATQEGFERNFSRRQLPQQALRTGS